MPVDKSPTDSSEGVVRPKQSSPLEMEVLWSKLRSIYQEAGEHAPFSPMVAGRIHHRTTVLNGQRSRKTRRSWNLAFSMAVTCFLLLLIIPLAPSLPGAGEAELGGMRYLAPSYDATNTATDNALPLQGPLVPKVAPVPEPTAEGYSPLLGMDSGRFQYRSVTLAWAAPEQIEGLLPSYPEAQQNADGSLLLTQSGQNRKDTFPVVERVVVFSQPIQGTEGMPIGSDLLLLAPSSSFPLGQESWLALAWRAFLAQVWPWGLILVLAALASLYFYFRWRRLWWAGVFLALLIVSLVWPLLSPSADGDRLLLESTDYVSASLLSSWPLLMKAEAPVTILSGAGNPPSVSPFALALGAPGEDLSMLLESYGLRIVDDKVPEKTIQWISLPVSQLFPLQLTLLSLRVLLLLFPLFLFSWVIFSRGLHMPMLKGEDRLPKLL